MTPQPDTARKAQKAEGSIFDILKKQHREVAELMEMIASSEEGERMDAFRRLRVALLSHAKAEEQTLYAALQPVEVSREITLEAIQEHRVVSGLMQELNAMNSQGEVWMAKFTVLKENVEHHVEEEEGEMFGKARQALPVGELNALPTTYLETQERFKRELATSERA